jgi:zinc transport system ATP-binding protein
VSDPNLLIEGRGLTLKGADGALLLEHVDVGVGPGEILSLIGPNGAGKTTLLRVLLGLIQPSAGEVRRRAGLRIGYMPQRLTVDPVLPLNVDRFIALAGPAATADKRRQALDDVGMTALAARPMHALSGGELQRVLMARALVHDPGVLVLDEPAQGVDVHGQSEMFDLIDRLRRLRGCGVILVSHDLHVVMARTDRVLCLNRHVCCAGRPETVSRHPEYLALFGAEAASFAVYTHAHDHAHDSHGHVVPATVPEAERKAHGHA